MDYPFLKQTYTSNALLREQCAAQYQCFRLIIQEHNAMTRDPAAMSDPSISAAFWKRMHEKFPSVVQSIADILDQDVQDLDSFSLQSSPELRTLTALVAAEATGKPLSPVDAKCVTTAILSMRSVKPDTSLIAAPYKALAHALFATYRNMQSLTVDDEVKKARYLMVGVAWSGYVAAEEQAGKKDTIPHITLCWREIAMMVCSLAT